MLSVCQLAWLFFCGCLRKCLVFCPKKDVHATAGIGNPIEIPAEVDVLDQECCNSTTSFDFLGFWVTL